MQSYNIDKPIYHTEGSPYAQVQTRAIAIRQEMVFLNHRRIMLSGYSSVIGPKMSKGQYGILLKGPVGGLGGYWMRIKSRSLPTER
jgi:hypothetical protein